jgi:uncharacterized protein involved in exopolysaccharide biosynthesis
MTEQDLYPDHNEAASDAVLPPEESGSAFSITAIRLLTHLVKNAKLIAAMTCIASIAGLLYALWLPNEYNSVAKIMPPKQTQSTTSLLTTQMGAGSLGDAASAGLSLKDPNSIYLGLLKSRPIADAIINEFGLEKLYRVKDMTGARKKLELNTKITSERSGLIAITVTDGDKKRAAALANAYADQLRTLTKTISVSEASKRRAFFEEQLADQKEVLVTAEMTFQQVQLNKGFVHLDAQTNVIIGSLAGVRTQIAAEQVKLQALKSYSTERNPEVQLAERELAAMQGEAAQLEQHNNPAGYSEMGLKDVPRAGLDYLRAARDLQYQQSLFDLLLKQYEAARLDEAKDAAVIQVAEPAIEADRKAAPARSQILLGFTIVGFLVSCLLTMVSPWLKNQRSNPGFTRAIQNLKSSLPKSRTAESLKA